MRLCILSAWPIQRHPARALRAARSALGESGRYLALGLLVLAAGCSGSGGGGLVEYAEVSGRVLYKGEPLPGGEVTFVTVEGEGARTGVIDENGNYKLQAPVGNVQIAVDNRKLLPHREAKKREAASKGAGPRPGAPEPSQIEIKGTYKKIPQKYYSTTDSGLTWKVEKGGGTHDIELQ